MEVIDDKNPVGMRDPYPGTYLFFLKKIHDKCRNKSDKRFLALLYDHLNALYVEQKVYRND